MADCVIAKTPELLCSNVPEEAHPVWDTEEECTAGDKRYVLLSYHDEEFTYGDCTFHQCSWDGDEWSYNATNLTYDCDGTQADPSRVFQYSSKIEGGEDYLAQFQIKTLTAGTGRPYLCGGLGTIREAVGYYQEIVTAGSSDEIMGVRGNSTFNGSLTNFSFKKTGPEVAKDIYEAQQTTSGEFPPDNLASWVRVSASNRWAMFDKKTSTATTNQGRIIVKLKSDEQNALGAFGLVAKTLQYIVSDDATTDTSSTAIVPGLGTHTFELDTGGKLAEGNQFEAYRSTDQRVFMAGEITSYDSETKEAVVDVTVYDDPDESGSYDDWTLALVYDNETVDLYKDDVLNADDYFFSPFSYKDSESYNFTVSYFTSCRVIISGDSDDTVQCGHLFVGYRKYMGETILNGRVGLIDYSSATVSTQGDSEFIRRGNVKNPTFDFLVDRSAADLVYQNFQNVTATPCGWNLNNDDTNFSMLLVFGSFSRAEVVFDDYDYDYVVINAEFKGVT